jgi:hypothetical protein
MAWTARDSATIRESILANRRARYLIAGYDLSTIEGSDAFREGDAYAIELEGVEQRALAMTEEIFPDSASEPMLERHAGLIGLARKGATSSVLNVTTNGTASTSFPITTETLNAADGIKYTAVDDDGVALTAIVTDVLGVANFKVKAQTTGIQTNKIIGTRLTWSSAPTGMYSQATVTSTATTAADRESNDDLKARVLRWWRDRPASGNRAHWLDWAESRSAVFRAYVYPVTSTTLGPHTLGAVRVLMLGAAAARTVSNPFGFSADNIQDFLDYVRGDGLYAASGGQISAGMDPEDAFGGTPAAQVQAVTLTIVNAASAPFPFTGTYTTAAGSTTTVINVTTDPSAAGATQVNTDDIIAVKMPATAEVRGGYAYRKVFSRNTTSITLADPLPAAPDPAVAVRPAAANCEAIKDAVLGIFDRLGPGDVDTGLYPRSARWPSSLEDGPFTLYRAALSACAMGIPGYGVVGITGVLSATATTPATDVTPPAFTQLVPGDIVLTA